MTLLFTQVFAMKPGPFLDVKYEDPQTHYRVESILDKKRGDFSSEGITTIYDSKKKKLWQSTLFVGRKKIQLSADGNTLALIGNFYFGGTIQPSKEEVIVELINQKETFKVIKLGDIYAGDIKKLIKDRKILEMGGGWASMSDFIKDINIQWDKKNVLVQFVDGKEHNFSF